MGEYSPLLTHSHETRTGEERAPCLQCGETLTRVGIDGLCAQCSRPEMARRMVAARWAKQPPAPHKKPGRRRRD